jgi:glycosyltransferase involved in cell wall biosynthesis
VARHASAGTIKATFMRIVFLEFVTNFGGAGRALVDFAQRLSACADVTILDVDGACKPFGQAADAAGIKRRVLLEGQSPVIIAGHGQPVLRLLNFARNLPTLRQAGRRAEQAIREIQPDIVISHNFKSASLLGFNRKLRDVRQIIYLHGWYTPDMMPWYGRKLLNERCAAVLAISRATKQAVVCSGIDPSKIHVLHNGIDIALIQQRAAQEPSPALPQAQRPVRIVLPASIIRTKGQHTAVGAMPRVLDAGLDAVLWLAGPYYAIYGANKGYPDRVRELIGRLGLDERVEWLGDREDMPAVFRASTQMILPTHTEGHPLAIVEAMALERPVAATPVGGVTDMVMPETTGLLFEVEDEPALAQCIIRFAREQELVDRVTANALHYLKTCFDPPKLTQQAMKIFERVTAK